MFFFVKIHLNVSFWIMFCYRNEVQVPPWLYFQDLGWAWIYWTFELTFWERKIIIDQVWVSEVRNSKFYDKRQRFQGFKILLVKMLRVPPHKVSFGSTLGNYAKALFGIAPKNAFAFRPWLVEPFLDDSSALIPGSVPKALDDSMIANFSQFLVATSQSLQSW